LTQRKFQEKKTIKDLSSWVHFYLSDLGGIMLRTHIHMYVRVCMWLN